MAEAIRVFPTSFGTSDWHVEFTDGGYICDIRLEISSMLNASRYYVLHDGKLVKEGTFNFGVWDYDAVREVLTALVKSMYSDATVTIDLPTRGSSAVAG